jgi:hypothetical protein
MRVEERLHTIGEYVAGGTVQVDAVSMIMPSVELSDLVVGFVKDKLS